MIKTFREGLTLAIVMPIFIPSTMLLLAGIAGLFLGAAIEDAIAPPERKFR